MKAPMPTPIRTQQPFSGFNNLFLARKFHTVSLKCCSSLRNINRVTVSDIFFHLIIEVNFSISVPPATAITKPGILFIKQQLSSRKYPLSKIRLPRSTIGEEIKKENVTPSGKPALVKPDKQRNGRTRAKTGYQNEQSGEDIRPYSVKSAEYLFSSSGGK